ncbi:HNH endonuclease [Nocardia sp. NPDC055002]
MWSSSNRSADLPENWEALRSQVLRRDQWICQIQGRSCLGAANEVDHILRGNDHSLGNLRAACSRCHGIKSAREGVTRREQLRAQRKRPTERHPGSR